MINFIVTGLFIIGAILIVATIALIVVASIVTAIVESPLGVFAFFALGAVLIGAMFGVAQMGWIGGSDDGPCYTTVVSLGGRIHKEPC